MILAHIQQKPEMNELFHDIRIYWDAPVFGHHLSNLLSLTVTLSPMEH